jgi:DNA-binding response OmpR family regulator
MRMTNGADYRLLLVEDDHELASMVTDYLRPHGFHVETVPRGDEAVARICADQPDMVVLDVNLPGMDGFSVCRQARPLYPGPILILTARAEEVDEVVGLEVGADDYLSKPIRPRAFLARLRVHLRKAQTGDAADERLTIGDLEVDAGRRVVTLSRQAVDLTTAEFDLLWLLAQNAGRPLSRRMLSEALLGLPHDGMDRSIDLRVSRLRRKLGDDPAAPQRVKSVRGVGYMLAKDP